MALIRSWIAPPIRLFWPSRLAMRGPYPTYEAARAEATGYDAPLIADTVEQALCSVLNGAASYERDGVAFQKRPDLPVLRALQSVVKPGCSVADFGGGLGGLFVNAPEVFSSCCQQLVIEQSLMVHRGRALAQDHGLPIEFIDSSLDPIPPIDVLILSSVLQYLRDPWQQIDLLLQQCCPAAVIVDRTAVWGAPSRWYLQTNPGYYSEPVTYPVQVLERQRLLASFPGYRLVRRWHNRFDPGRPEHLGLLLLRESPAAVSP